MRPVAKFLLGIEIFLCFAPLLFLWGAVTFGFVIELGELVLGKIFVPSRVEPSHDAYFRISIFLIPGFFGVIGLFSAISQLFGNRVLMRARNIICFMGIGAAPLVYLLYGVDEIDGSVIFLALLPLLCALHLAAIVVKGERSR